MLIVGSGPVGATFAKVMHDRSPHLRIRMVEVGPKLTAENGMHLRNVEDPELQADLRMRAQGPMADVVASRMVGPLSEIPDNCFAARPGTFLLGAEPASGLPAAAMSSCVGGMGVHWTCWSPRPRGTERIPFIPASELDRALAQAEALLKTSQAIFPVDSESEAIRAAIKERLPPGVGVEPAPFSGEIDEAGILHWSGTRTIIGALFDEASEHFRLLPETLCTRLLVEGRRVTGAVVRDMRSGGNSTIRAKVVVVACDGLRTPQLLFASGIRPPALGRYLNEHAIAAATVRLSERFRRSKPKKRLKSLGDWIAPTFSAYWVPFDDSHPYHAQIVHYSLAPFETAASSLGGDDLINLSWFAPKDISEADRIRFDDASVDHYGMPKPSICYGLSDKDRVIHRQMLEELTAIGSSLGEFMPNESPTMLPPGTSLHYQGTVRMGRTDDGTSVCDSDGKVWGLDNLFLGGNGVIPTATACNPTLTSVALAVRSADAVRLAAETADQSLALH